MNHTEAIETNEQAFRRMKPTLDARFPAGHLIAFDGGEVIADAASVQELRPLLIGAGKNPSRVFVVQAGTEYRAVRDDSVCRFQHFAYKKVIP
jgi:hypothetical protein